MTNEQLALLGEACDTFKGSEKYLDNENTPVISPAAEDLAKRVESYSPENLVPRNEIFLSKPIGLVYHHPISVYIINLCIFRRA